MKRIDIILCVEISPNTIKFSFQLSPYKIIPFSEGRN